MPYGPSGGGGGGAFELIEIIPAGTIIGPGAPFESVPISYADNSIGFYADIWVIPFGGAIEVDVDFGAITVALSSTSVRHVLRACQQNITGLAPNADTMIVERLANVFSDSTQFNQSGSSLRIVDSGGAGQAFVSGYIYRPLSSS